MHNIVNDILSSSSIIKITISDKQDKTVEYNKISIRPIIIKGGEYWQAECFKDNKVFHQNIESSLFSNFLLESVLPYYKQITLFTSGNTIAYSINKAGKVKKSQTSNNLQSQNTVLGNNRQKNYILKEGENIPALVELGVFTKEYKIVASKYDKFKQINRFVELIDDAYKNSSEENLTILDFGCGKSYLTFIVYYYFNVIKKMNVKIIGYDLKADVVNHCNQIAKKYDYTGLEFVVSDITKDNLTDMKIDMIITLHACDIATDYALYYAISKGVKNIFSVPCCQHEINGSITQGGDFDLLIKYGLIKERFSALLTDSIRATILESYGYDVDVIDFVDLSHTPKNLMLRAKKCKKTNLTKLDSIYQLQDTYKFSQKLLTLIKQK